MIEELLYTDVGRWVMVTEDEGKTSRGRIKAYQNHNKSAWIVSEENNPKLGEKGDMWKLHSSRRVDYSRIAFVEGETVESQ